MSVETRVRNGIEEHRHDGYSRNRWHPVSQEHKEEAIDFIETEEGKLEIVQTILNEIADKLGNQYQGYVQEYLDESEVNVLSDMEYDEIKNDFKLFVDVLEETLGKQIATTHEDHQAIVIDHEVTEITGYMRNIVFTDDFKTGYVEVEDIDGNNHVINVSGARKIWHIFYLLDGKKYLNGLAPISAEMSVSEQSDEIRRLSDLNKPIIFRTTYDKETNSMELFATVTNKYMKTKIEDLVPIIEKTLKNKDDLRIVDHSTGRYGGKAELNLHGDTTATYKIGISAGILDGMNSIRIWGHGAILSCTNQMTLEVGTAFKDVPLINLGAKTVHAGDPENFEKKLIEIMSRVTQFSEVITEAQKISIDETETKRVLDFYETTGTISKKVRTIIETNMTDDIQQVPGTVWGLSMVMTWVGTHQMDLTDGVRYKLQKIGGELLIVASNWPKYEEVVDKKLIEVEAKVS